jgi:ribosomal protein S18 acetylase RimI-like enzyme
MAGTRAEDVSFAGRRWDELSPARLSEIVAMLTSSFGEWPQPGLAPDPYRYLGWKLQTPLPACTSFLGLHGDRVVTFMSVASVAYRFGGDRVMRTTVADGSTHPEWRRLGLASRRYAHYLSDVGASPHFSLSRTHNKAMRRIFRQLGFRPMKAQCRVLVRGVDRSEGRQEPRGTERRRPHPTRVLAPLGRLQRSKGSRAAPAGLEVGPLARFDQRLDELFERVAPSFDLIGERTATQLNWRYCDPRAGTFEVRIANLSTRLVGYSATRILHGRGYLADLIVDPEHPDVARPLVQDAVTRLILRGAEDIVAWAPHDHPLRRHLQAEGFVDTRKPVGISFVARGLSDAQRRLLANAETRLHFMPGDTDEI